MQMEPDDAPDLTPLEAQAWQRDRALLVDVRELEEWQAGRIAGAIHLPLSELADRWQELPDADQTVFVCRAGSRSRAWRASSIRRCSCGGSLAYSSSRSLRSCARW